MDDKTKQFLIKAMVEGIHCNLPTVESIEDYIIVLKDLVEENENIKSSLDGDFDGLFMNDSRLQPYAIIKFKSDLITFGLLVPESELTDQQSKDFGRIVLACISAIAKEEMQQKIEEDKNRYSSPSFGYKTKKYGFGYFANFDYSEEITVSSGFRFEDTEGYSAKNNNDYITDSIGQFQNVSLQFSITQNSTNDFFYP